MKNTHNNTLYNFIKKGDLIKIKYINISPEKPYMQIKSFTGICKKHIKNNRLILFQIVKREMIEILFPLESPLIIKVKVLKKFLI